MKHNIQFIPPFFLFTDIVIIGLLYFLLPDYNIIPFPYNLAGVAVSFLGFVIMGKANDLLKKHKTTFALKESAAIVKDGIFNYSRNPMYLGMVILLIGIAICFGNIFSLVAPFLFWLYLALIIIPIEEELMKKVFGDEYLNYKKTVRRWI